MDKLNKQLRKAEKGGAIRKAGFLTGVHTLPIKAKNRLDEMLLCRYSPEKALSKLEREFPRLSCQADLRSIPTKPSIYLCH